MAKITRNMGTKQKTIQLQTMFAVMTAKKAGGVRRSTQTHAKAEEDPLAIAEAPWRLKGRSTKVSG